MEIISSPSIGLLDTRYLKLDQSTLQTLTASPIFTGFTNSSVPFFFGGQLTEDNSHLTFNPVSYDLYAYTISTSQLTVTGWTPGWVLYAGAGGVMTGENEFSYNTATNLLSVPSITSTGTITAGDIVIPDMKLGSPTYSSLNDFFRIFTSAGRVSGGAITDAGSQTVNVAAGTGLLRIADDDISQVKFFNWSAATGLSVPTNTVRYVGVEYNSGTPQVVIRTTQNWDYDTDFPLGSVINQADDLYVLNDSWWIGDGLTNVIERFQSEGTVRDNFVGGLMIGTSTANTTRKPTLTAGTVWSRLSEFDIDTKDCSATDTFYGFYRDGGTGWTRTVAKTDIDDFYDNNSGTLQALSANKYVNFWLFVEVDTVNNGQLMVIYPQNQYNTAAAAEAEEVPVFPSIWFKHGILLGRIQIKQGVTTPIKIQSSFSTVFNAALAADHGNLSGLSDDDHPQYVLDAGDTMTGQLLMSDSKPVSFGTGTDASLQWDETQAIDSLQLGLAVNNNEYSGYFSLMEKSDIGSVNRTPLAVTANPTFRVYSSDEASNLDYIEMFHNQTTGVIQSGTDNISFGDDNLTTSGTIAGGTVTGINITSGENPGHTHTGSSLSGIDISADTNLAGGDGITLTDDTLSVDFNSTNLKITTAQLNTIQDIDTTATPSFAGLLATDKIKFTQTDGNEYIDSLADGYLDLGATTAIRLKQVTIAESAIYFTQTDGNEYIDSLNDGYLDLGATTSIRLRGTGDTSDIKLEFVSGNTGYIQWQEDEQQFYISGAVIIESPGVFNSGGGIILPSADPHIIGSWWDNAGTLTRSAG